MKKIALLLFLLPLFLVSCKKCADCTITVTTKTTGQMPYTAYSTTELCGSDLKEADGNTMTSTATVNGYTSTITTRTTCK